MKNKREKTKVMYTPPSTEYNVPDWMIFRDGHTVRVLTVEQYLLGELPRAIKNVSEFATTNPSKKAEINIEVFTMECFREPSSNLWKLLADAVVAGVHVRLLLDDYGCNDGNIETLSNGHIVKFELPAFFIDYAVKAGIQVAIRRKSQMSHRKMSLFIMGDQKLAFVGGCNILAGYLLGLTVKGEVKAIYTDKQFMVNGKMADWIYDSFCKIWKETTKEFPYNADVKPVDKKDIDNFKTVINDLAVDHHQSSPLSRSSILTKTWENVQVGLVPTSGVRCRPYPEKIIINLIDMAKMEVIIRSPYVALTPSVIEAVRRAKRRSVKVIFVTGKESDLSSGQKKLLDMTASLSCACCKARLIRNPNNFHHDKLIVVDRKFVLVGSMNTDILSTLWLYELSLIINDERIALELLEILCEECPEFSKYYYKESA